MAVPFDSKQIVSSEELLMSQVVSQEAVIRLFVEKGIFTKEEFWKQRGWWIGSLRVKVREISVNNAI